MERDMAMKRSKKEYAVTGSPAGAPVHPGAILRKDVLPALRVSVKAAAKDLGISRQTLHRILAESHPVTPEMAIRLGKWCGNGPDLWLRLQQEYDLRQAEKRLRSKVRAIPTRREAA
jgi:addiction module HigA family antidote